MAEKNNPSPSEAQDPLSQQPRLPQHAQEAGTGGSLSPSPTPPLNPAGGEGGRPPPPQPSPPSEEQKRYWELDLRYKVIQLLVSVVGFFLIIVGLALNYWQAGNVAKATRANVGHSVVTHVTNLDKVFLERPYLMVYFYDGKPIDKKDEKFAEVRAAAVMVLDVFDLIATQNRHFPEYWDKPGAWDEWMIDVFATSPILRETFDEYQDWYGEGLKDKRRRGEARMKAEEAQKEKAKGS
jgi:hypothetical protein